LTHASISFGQRPNLWGLPVPKSASAAAAGGR
jgi:hypothetical protein